MLGARGPDLLPVEHELVAVAAGPGLHAGEVRARTRLAEELAPDVLAPQQRRDERPLLLLAGVHQQRGPAHAEPDLERAGRDLERLGLAVEDALVAAGQPTPAVLDRPGDAGQAGLGQLALDRRRHAGDSADASASRAAASLARQRGPQEGQDLVAEGLLVGAARRSSSPSCRDLGRGGARRPRASRRRPCPSSPAASCSWSMAVSEVMERSIPSTMVTAARASSSLSPGRTSQRRCTHSAMRTRSMRATRRRASSSSERYSLTKTSRRLPFFSCSTMAASIRRSSVTMRRRVLVEDVVHRLAPRDRRLLDQDREQLALALEVAVDGRPADAGGGADVAQARLPEAALAEEVGGGRHDRLPGPLPLGRPHRGSAGAVPSGRVAAACPSGLIRSTDVSHPSQNWAESR